MKKLSKAAGGALLVLVLVLAVLKGVADARYFSAYDAAAPLNAEVAEDAAKDGYRLVKVYFDGMPGERVPTLLTLPPDAAGPVPCAIFLHGIGQEKGFLEEITRPFNEAGFAMASFDQYTRGERRIPKEAGAWAEAKAFYERPARTINDTRRLVSYLQSDKRIDPNRIYVLGASYGAITGSTATSFDPRIKAAVLTYGGGNINKLLRAPYIVKGAQDEGYGWLLPIVRPIAAFVLSASDPVRYVGGISPRPVLFQGGKRDGLVAPEATQALFDAAKDPKSITWYDSDHIGMDEEIVRQVLAEALNWIREQDKKVLEAAAAAPRGKAA